MKLIIDISNTAYEAIQAVKGFTDEATLENVLIMAVANGTPIPDNATNGDVLDKLFPDLTYGTNGEHYHVWSNDGKCSMNIHQDFWNSPYQKGGKE